MVGQDLIMNRHRGALEVGTPLLETPNDSHELLVTDLVVALRR